MKSLLPCSILLLVVLGMESADALPRFASRTGARCQSCHVNPSGGGMRQTFGVKYGREELPVPTWSEELGLEDFTTKLSELVSIGADVRTLYYYQQIPDTGAAASSSDQNAFWQMQGDVYMNFRLAKKVQVYLDKGLYSGFEVFGLLSILPANGYIKIGKFIPNFGLKVDDHRAYVRQYTGFSPEVVSPEFDRPERTGGEVAISPGPVTITGGFYNSLNGGSAPPNSNQKAVLGRVEGLFKAAEEITVGVGGNVFTTKNSSGERRTLLGGFGLFSYQDLTLMGEADLIENKAVGGTTKGMVMTLEADYVVTPGVDLKVGYDFHDPDTDIQLGAVSRYSLGLEFFPISGVEVRPVYRIVKDEPNELKNDEFQVLIHFYF
jgi:hypothetical protein